MVKYVIFTEETKAIKKSIKKFSERDIASFNDKLRGSFKIVGFRRYQFHDEVDIEIEAKGKEKALFDYVKKYMVA